MLLMHGIIYGILIALIAYFSLLCIRLKTASARWFTIFLIFFSGFVYLFNSRQFNLPLTGFSDLVTYILIFITGLLYFTGLKFLRTFLNIFDYSDKLDRAMQVLQWAGLLTIPVNLFSGPFVLIFNIFVIGIGSIFSSCVAVFLRLKGNPSLTYFAVGWVVFQATFVLLVICIVSHISPPPTINFAISALLLLSLAFMGLAVTDEADKNRKYAFIDGQTGIANRRLVEQVIRIEWNRNLRKQLPLSLIMAGIDEFDMFYQTYGSSKTHKALKAVAHIFDKHLQRAGDLAARYGNNEFIAVLPDTTASEAAFLAEKIRDAVEALAVKHEQSLAGKILTVSLGTATLVPTADKDPTEMILSADDALSQARGNGGNHIASIDLGENGSGGHQSPEII